MFSTTTTMKAISADSKAQIISLLSAGLSTRQIASQTHHSIGSISKICSEHLLDATKSIGGHPSKLSPTNIRHAVHLLSTDRAGSAVQVARHLMDITHTPLSPQTVRGHLKKAGLKAVVKKNKPLLTPRHRRNRLDYAIAHQDWTVEDWKRVIFSDETKINRLGVCDRPKLDLAIR